MTSTTSGFRRTVIAATAAVAALGLSACSAGQHTQTSTQSAAIDGGSAWSRTFSVHDLRVVLPAEEGGEATVGFGAAYRGANLGNPEGVEIQSITIDGKDANIAENKQLTRNCALIAAVDEGAGMENEDALPERSFDPCVQYIDVTIPADGFEIGQSYPSEVAFSNGETLQVLASVGMPYEEAGQYTRESDAE